MFLPFEIPHKGLQAMRKRWFYWRVVYAYRLGFQNDFLNRKVLHKFSKFFLGVMVIKAFEKGARARREEHLSDYHARKANVEAAETKLWDEELALHKADTEEAEKSVHRQRVLDWKLRERPDDFAVAMLNMRFPFHVSA